MGMGTRAGVGAGSGQRGRRVLVAPNSGTLNALAPNSLFCFLQREQTVLLIGDKTGWNTEGDFNIAGIHRDFS